MHPPGVRGLKHPLSNILPNLIAKYVRRSKIIWLNEQTIGNSLSCLAPSSSRDKIFFLIYQISRLSIPHYKLFSIP